MHRKFLVWIPDHEVGVIADLNCALARETGESRRRKAHPLSEPRQRLIAGQRDGPHRRQAVRTGLWGPRVP